MGLFAAGAFVGAAFLATAFLLAGAAEPSPVDLRVEPFLGPGFFFAGAAGAVDFFAFAGTGFFAAFLLGAVDFFLGVGLFVLMWLNLAQADVPCCNFF